MAAWACQVGPANPLTLETVIKPVTPNTGEISSITGLTDVTETSSFHASDYNGVLPRGKDNGVTPNAEKDNGVTPNADMADNLNAVTPNKAGTSISNILYMFK